MVNTTDSGSVDLGSNPGASTISMQDLTDALWPPRVDRMPTWFTSDLHFGHKNIIKYEGRPFNDVDEMNHALVDNWNRTVGPDDVVWIVGDFAMGKIVDTLPIAKDLNGKKLLVPGNHDRCWHGHYDLQSSEQFDKFCDWRDRYEEVGLSIQSPYETITADNWPMVRDHTVVFNMSHFPYESDGRYPGVVDHGNWLVHGHVHSEWRMKGKQINVGIDAWGGDLVSEIVLQHTITKRMFAHQPAISWGSFLNGPWPEAD